METNQMSEELTNEIKKRRTIAIISHPHAGKTTMTEKFLLYGGSINTAGYVKGKANSKYALSDWMEIEKERCISVTSSVLHFNYDDFCINILELLVIFIFTKLPSVVVIDNLLSFLYIGFQIFCGSIDIIYIQRN